MSATAKLDDYLKQFRTEFKPKDWEECSVDTEMLLNDSISLGSDISSRYPSISKKSKTIRSSSTKILKTIKEEDTRQVMYDINDYLPNRTHLQTVKSGAFTSRNGDKIDLNRLQHLTSSKNSVAMSEDTEALLESSDEELDSQRREFARSNRYRKDLGKPSLRSGLKLSDEMETSRGKPVVDYIPVRASSTKSSVKECTTPCFNFALSKNEKHRTSSINLNKENTLQMDHLKISSIKIPSLQTEIPSPYLRKPPLNTKEEKLRLEVCTCILKGIKKTHLKTCRPILIDAILQSPQIRPKKKLGLVQSIILIQRAFRNYLKSRKNLRASQLITARKSSQSPLRRSINRQSPGISSYHRSDEQAFLSTKRSLINPLFTLTDSGVSHNLGSNSSSAMSIQDLFSPKLNTVKGLNVAKNQGKWMPPTRMDSSSSCGVLNSFNSSVFHY